MHTILCKLGRKDLVPAKSSAVAPLKEEKPTRPYNEPPWEKSTGETLQLQLNGDAKIVVDWANGHAALKAIEHKINLRVLRTTLANLWTSLDVHPIGGYSNWIQHQYREHNAIADALATLAVTTRDAKWVLRPLPPSTCTLWGAFDGGKRTEGSGMGF